MKLFSEYRGLRRELYILFIGNVMTNLGAMVWPMFTLILSRKLGLSAGIIAVCMMIYSFCSMPITLIGGKLADKFNKKHIIVICDLISILSFFYCAAVPMTIPTMVIFAAAGLFQSIERPSYSALVADLTNSDDRERAYSLSYLGMNLGLVLSPSIGGILFNDYLNIAFLINGLSIAVSTFLIAFFIKDVHREVEVSPKGAYEAEVDDHTPVLKLVLQNRVVLLYIIFSSLSGLVYGMFNYLMPLDLTAVHGDTGSVLYGTMTSVNAIVVVLFTAAITRWLRKVRDIDKMFLGEALILAGFVIFLLFIRNAFLCYAAITVFTLGEITNTISADPFVMRRIPASHRGRVLSVQEVVNSLLYAGLEVVIGVVYDNAGSIAAWGLVFVFGACVLLLIRITRVFDRRDFTAFYAKEEPDCE